MTHQLIIARYTESGPVPLTTLVLPLGTNQLDVTAHYAVDARDRSFYGGKKEYSFTIPKEQDEVRDAQEAPSPVDEVQP